MFNLFRKLSEKTAAQILLKKEVVEFEKLTRKLSEKTAAQILLKKEVVEFEKLINRFLNANGALTGVYSYRNMFGGYPIWYFRTHVEALESKIQEKQEKQKLKNQIADLIKSGEFPCCDTCKSNNRDDPRQPEPEETK